MSEAASFFSHTTILQEVMYKEIVTRLISAGAFGTVYTYSNSDKLSTFGRLTYSMVCIFFQIYLCKYCRTTILFTLKFQGSIECLRTSFSHCLNSCNTTETVA